MQRTAEKILFDLISDPENLEICILSNLDASVIPTEELRPIYQFAVDYFTKSSQRVAPTIDVYRETEYPGIRGKSMYQALEEQEILLDEEPQESIEWVIEQLKGQHLAVEVENVVKEMVREIAGSPNAERPDALAKHATELVGLSQSYEPRTTRVDFREDADELLGDYSDIKENSSTHMGMHFGLPEIDSHTFGIHPGELAIVAAHAKAGKSFFLNWVALQEFLAGRKVGIFTLENSIKMTEGRIACLATGVDPERWSKGQSHPDEEEAVQTWVNDVLKKADNSFYIMSPGENDRTATSMVTKAKLLDVDSILIDQLTFVTAPNTSVARWEQIRDSMHDIKTQISTGRKKLPCLLAHQVNRDGHKDAQKTGHYEMWHMAEGAEVERTADWVFAMYQSADHLAINRLLFQTLATRRAIPKNWELHWDIGIGDIRVASEVSLA